MHVYSAGSWWVGNLCEIKCGLLTKGWDMHDQGKAFQCLGGRAENGMK